MIGPFPLRGNKEVAHAVEFQDRWIDHEVMERLLTRHLP